MSHTFDPSIVREYDIRGQVGRTLGPDDARAVGRSFASILRRSGGHRVAVGYDGRLSSSALKDALIDGLLASGADVIEIGLGPSPMLYFAEASEQDIHGGVQVTGSHNPADHNGFKIVKQGRPFFGPDLVELARVAAAGEWLEGGRTARARHEQREILPAYAGRLLADLDGLDPGELAKLRIAWDAGNGAAGPAVEALTGRLPGEHHLLFCDVDGHFPNHHPDPTIDANLAQLRERVLDNNLHFGVAFDGDGDRIAIVDGLGRVLRGDQLLAILAEDLLREVPGATIIADVKSSDTLFDRVAALGGVPVMWKTGHSVLKAKMNETGALLAGEMSGHIFFAHHWYGFDDALLAAIRLICACVRTGRSVAEMRSAMPEVVDTPDIRMHVPDDAKFAIIDRVAGRLARAGAQVDTTDGVRVRTDDGWWLLRASNTQAMLTARAESGDAAGLARQIEAIAEVLAAEGIARPAELG